MPESVPALAAPPPKRDNPLTRSKAGLVGLAFLVLMLGVCLGTLPWTLGRGEGNVPRYNEGRSSAGRLPPFWVSPTQDQARRFNRQVDAAVVEQASKVNMKSPGQGGVDATTGPVADELRKHWPR